jgi:hypothetical protein
MDEPINTSLLLGNNNVGILLEANSTNPICNGQSEASRPAVYSI